MLEQEEFQARAWLLADGGETGIETEVEEEGDIALESEGKGQLVLVVDDLEDSVTSLVMRLRSVVIGSSRLPTVSRAIRLSVTADRTCYLRLDDAQALSHDKQVRANADVANR